MTRSTHFFLEYCDELVIYFELFGSCFWHEFEIEFQQPEAIFWIGDVVFLAEVDVFGPLIVDHQ